MEEQGVAGGFATIKNVFWRILAVFAASGLSVLGCLLYTSDAADE